MGDDPLKAKQEQRNSPTLAEALNAFLDDPETLQLRPSSLRSYTGISENILKKSALEKQPLKTITRAEIVALHAKQKHRPYQGNRMLALLSVVYSYAVHPDRAWVEKNPVIGITRHKEEKRKRYLKPVEVDRFYKALDSYIAKHHGTRHEQNAKDAVCALRLLLLTGSRLSEVLGADWSEFDLETGLWQKPADRMKAGEESEIPLNPAALDVLLSMSPKDHGALFVGRNGRKPRVSLKRPWDYAITTAKLHNVRKHDLRHSFASFAISEGVPLAVVGGLLAHKQVSTTARYAHLLNDALRSGTNAVGNVLTMRKRA
jgi:integrase